MQTGAGLPRAWGVFQGQSLPGHYSLATNLLTVAELQAGLRTLPSLFILTDSTNLFAPGTGIYLHPTERGPGWERAATVLLLEERGQTNFQIRCGLRIHGGMSRRPEESPKHSFRFAFRREYGAGKLRASLFGNAGSQDFDDLVLRAGGSDSWLSSDGSHRRHATYLRDEWMRRSMEVLGHRSARGKFVHLYLNELYWGIYNLCERPGAAMLPGGMRDSECDILKGDEIESGDRMAWDKLINLANSGLGDTNRYQEVARQLDVPQFMDFVLLNLFAGNTDWDRLANWYAIRPRTADGKFRFFIWDAEQVLHDSNGRLPDSPDDNGPLALFHQLSRYESFRAEFAARAERLLADDGVFSPVACAGRFRALADAIDGALPLEAARWGTYRREVHQFKTGPFEVYRADSNWSKEVGKLSAEFFSRRREVLQSELRERGLFKSQ